MRAEGWLTLATIWVPMTTLRFAAWVRRHLLRVLRPGDIVSMDNLTARVQELVASVGATVRYLPPYSYDFNPIEHTWALIKQRLRRLAPRTSDALRGGAQRVRRVVQPRHCRNWAAHAGYTLK